MTSKKSRSAAIYLRISLDQTGEGLALDRQREDCLRIVKERGWKLVAEFADEMPSSKTKRRPAYSEMVSAYEAGEFDALVCYDLDRLTRQPRELEDWIDRAEENGLAIVTANGEADLTTDGGRMYARIKCTVAKAEVERKSARQRRAAEQRSKLGRPPLGVRLTGYTVKGDLVPDEAKVIRRIFKMFAAGESLKSIARILGEDGIVTRRGTPWNPSTIRGILVNPRYAGRAVYQGSTYTGEDGRLQMGNWKPLVDGGTFDEIQRTLADERRKTNRIGTDRKHLGSGLYLCAVCGEPCSSWSGKRYRCRESHVLRSMPQVDEYVLATVSEWIRESGDVIAAKLQAEQTPDAKDVVALDELRQRQKQTEADYDADLIDGRRYRAKMEKLAAEMKAVEKRLAKSSRSSALASVLASGDPAQAFLDAPLMSQRSIVASLVDVRLRRGKHGSRSFDPASVEVVPNF